MTKRQRIVMIYPMQGFSVRVVRHIPLGLLYVSSNLVKQDYDVKIFDARLAPKRLARKIGGDPHGRNGSCWLFRNVWYAHKKCATNWAFCEKYPRRYSCYLGWAARYLQPDDNFGRTECRFCAG